MRQVYRLLPLAAMLSIGLGSCGLFRNRNDSSEPVPPGLDSPSGSELFETDPNFDSDANTIFGPELLSSVLIPSTDPDARRRVTEEGRTDPFADLPVAPQVRFAPIEPTPSRVNESPQASSPETSATSTPKPTPSRVNESSQASSPKTSTAPTPKPTPPPPPQPTAAQNTVVTGAVRTGNADYVTLKADGEEFSRYVKVGDYVSNGRVLVKSVSFNRGVPIVTLQQNGITVAKRVEDRPDDDPEPTETGSQAEN